MAHLLVIRKQAAVPIIEDHPSAAVLTSRLRKLGAHVGTRLTSALFSDAAREATLRRLLDAARGPARLMLRAGPGPLADQVLALPWELLTLEEGVFAVEVGQLDIIREATSDAAATLPEPSGPVRVAVTISAPKDQAELSYEEEQFRLHEALAPLGQQVGFTDLGSVGDLIELVHGQKPHVIHFSGHGLPGRLVFEDEYGFADPVKIETLVAALKAGTPETGDGSRLPFVFFLASCYGASGTAEKTWQNENMSGLAALQPALGPGPSTAATLHRSGFVQVIGYFGPVGDQLCTRAEERFYRAVARGETVLHAAREARVSLGEVLESRGSRLRYPLGWTQLAVYHRGADRPIGTPGEVSRTEPGARFRRRVVEVGKLPVLQVGFIGRRELLHEMRQRIRSGQRLIVLQGLGGLGKTALASHLLSRVLAPNPADQLIFRCGGLEQAVDPVGELRAQAEEHGFVHQLASWSEHVERLREDVPEAVAGLAAVVTEIRKARPALVIYADNTDALQLGPGSENGSAGGALEVGRWKPEAGPWGDALPRLAEGGLVLVSTRYFWPGLAPEARLPVPPMNTADVHRMIEACEELAELPFEIARKIAERVDGHPQTVELLDRLLGERRRRLTRPPTDIWSDLVAPLLGEQRQKVTADLLLEDLWKRFSPAARQQALEISVLNSPVPGQVIARLGNASEELVRTSLLSRHRFPVQIADERRIWEDRWGFHSLVRDFVTVRLAESDRRSAERKAGLALKDWVKSGKAVMQDLEEGIRLLHAAGAGNEAWSLTSQLVAILFARARHREALVLLSVSERAGTSGDSLAVLLAQTMQARLHLGDRSDELDELLSRAHELASTAEARVEIAMLRGILYDTQGKLVAAEAVLHEARMSQEDAAGKENSTYARILKQLAGVLSHRGRYAEAEGFSRESLAIKGRILGNRHREYAESLHDLVEVLARQGKHSDAEYVARQYLEISEKISDGDHPIHALALHQLGFNLLVQGKYDEAERYFRESLSIRRRVSGRNHPEYATTLHALATALFARGDAEQAARAAHEALSIREQILDKEDPVYAMSLAQVAIFFSRRGRHEKAEKLLREAVEIQERAPGGNPSNLCSTLASLTVALVEQGRAAEAEVLAQRALEVAEKAFGARSTDVAQALANLAQIQEEAGNPAAPATAARAYVTMLEVFGPQHPIFNQSYVALQKIIAIGEAVEEYSGRPETAEKPQACADLAAAQEWGEPAKLDLPLEARWSQLSPEAREQGIRMGVLRRPAPRFVIDELGSRAVELIGAGFVMRFRNPGIRADTREPGYVDRWSLHPAVHPFVVGQTSEDEKRSAQRLAGLAYKKWLDAARILISDLEDCIRLLHDANEGEAAWPLVEREVQRLRSEARYAEALELLRASEAAGVGGDTLAQVLVYSAQLRHAMGARSPEVMELIERAQSLAVSDETRGTIAYALGTLIHARGELAGAQRAIRESLELQGEADDVGHVIKLNELARILGSQGRFAEAEQGHRQGLEFLEKLGHEKSPLSAALLLGLAEDLSAQNKTDEAEQTLRRGLAIQRETIGEMHPDHASALHGLASILGKQGKHAEQEATLRQVLEIRDRSLGASHPAYAKSLHQLAASLFERGRYDESEILLRQALDIKEKTLGRDDPSFAVSLERLAKSFEMRREHGEAEKLLRQALEIKERALGESHPELASVLEFLAAMLAEQGARKKASLCSAGLWPSREKPGETTARTWRKSSRRWHGFSFNSAIWKPRCKPPGRRFRSSTLLSDPGTRS
ncbi:MAG: tetratricopeptide repeat protein [Thermoanaerobaculia bacterium]|nr:tetratricopeptide repeat protein [Thermoanaerobaculia bacterium]